MGPGEKTGERDPYFTSCQATQESAPVALLELMLLQVHDVVKGTPQTNFTTWSIFNKFHEIFKTLLEMDFAVNDFTQL